MAEFEDLRSKSPYSARVTVLRVYVDGVPVLRVSMDGAYVKKVLLISISSQLSGIFGSLSSGLKCLVSVVPFDELETQSPF